MTRKIIAFSLVLTLNLVGVTTYAQFKDQKVIIKSAAVSHTGKLYVSNRHGNIQLVSWDKDSVVMTARINGQSKSLAKLHETMAKTNVEFRQNGNTINIATLIAETTFDRSLTEIKNLAGSQNEITIDYTISVPKNLKISASNQFGDIYLNNHSGELNLEISHGNIRANNLNKVAYLKSNFGNIYISDVGDLKGNLLFAEMDIEQAISLSLSGKSTTYEIGNVNMLQINTNGDKLNIDKVSNLKIAGNLSKISIDKLSKSADINLKYGKVKIKRIEKEVCSFTANTTRTNFDIGISPSLIFNLDGIIAETDVTSLNPSIKIKRADGVLEGNAGQGSSCTFQFNCQKSSIIFR